MCNVPSTLYIYYVCDAQCCTQVEGVDKIIALGALFHNPAPNNNDADYFLFLSRDIKMFDDNQIHTLITQFLWRATTIFYIIILFGEFTSHTQVLFILYTNKRLYIII